MSRQDARNEPGCDLDALAHSVIGAVIEVHSHLGPGYQEAVYEEALALELGLRGIPCERQVSRAVSYKGQGVGTGKLDLLVDGQLVVELKAVEKLLPLHKAQVISSLRATDCVLGLLNKLQPRLSIRTRDDGEVGCETVSLLARSPWLFHGRRTSGKNGRKPAASARVGAKRRLMDNLGSTSAWCEMESKEWYLPTNKLGALGVLAAKRI